MSDLLEMAVQAARGLSPEKQDQAARAILDVINGADEDVYALSDDERDAINVARSQIARGEFATEEEIEAIFKKYAS